MNLLQSISNQARQEHTIELPDGRTFLFELYYIELQRGWFIENLVFEEFTLKGLRVVNSPNILHQFRNKLPFGISCRTEGGREPQFIDDFNESVSKLYILNQDEVAQFARFLVGQV